MIRVKRITRVTVRHICVTGYLVRFPFSSLPNDRDCKRKWKSLQRKIKWNEINYFRSKRWTSSIRSRVSCDNFWKKKEKKKVKKESEKKRGKKKKGKPTSIKSITSIIIFINYHRHHHTDIITYTRHHIYTSHPPHIHYHILILIPHHTLSI